MYQRTGWLSNSWLNYQLKHQNIWWKLFLCVPQINCPKNNFKFNYIFSVYWAQYVFSRHGDTVWVKLAEYLLAKLWQEWESFFGQMRSIGTANKLPEKGYNSNCFSLNNNVFSVRFSNVPEDSMVFKLLAKLPIKASKFFMEIYPNCASNKLCENNCYFTNFSSAHWWKPCILSAPRQQAWVNLSDMNGNFSSGRSRLLQQQTNCPKTFFNSIYFSLNNNSFSVPLPKKGGGIKKKGGGGREEGFGWEQRGQGI